MAATIKEIDPATAREMLDGAGTLIDVRENDEWVAGRAPGALHRPLGELDVTAYSGTDPLIVVCRSGGRSSKAAKMLAAAGVEVHNLAGGMKAWEAAGHPVVRDDDAPGSVI